MSLSATTGGAHSRFFHPGWPAESSRPTAACCSWPATAPAQTRARRRSATGPRCGPCRPTAGSPSTALIGSVLSLGCHFDTMCTPTGSPAPIGSGFTCPSSSPRGARSAPWTRPPEPSICSTRGPTARSGCTRSATPVGRCRSAATSPSSARRTSSGRGRRPSKATGPSAEHSLTASSAAPRGSISDAAGGGERLRACRVLGAC